MKTLKYIYYYLTSSSFRWRANFLAKQQLVDRLSNEIRDNMEMSLTTTYLGGSRKERRDKQFNR